MKTLSSIAKGVVGLLLIAALIVLFNALFASAERGFQDTADNPVSAPSNIPTVLPPVDVSKLHVVKQTRVDDTLQCGQRIEIAPDGEHFVCPNVVGNRGVWLGSFSKGLDKQLADKPGYVQWFPDGKKIAYSIGVPYGGLTTLYEVDVESGSKTQIGTTTDASHFRALRSGKVLFLQKSGIQAWDPTTAKSQPLFSERSTSQAIVANAFSNIAPTADSNFIVSPDEQHVALQSVFYEQGILTLTDLTSGQVITLTDQIGNTPLPVAWSPDGLHLAYSTQSEEKATARLWLTDTDGDNPHQVWQTTDCTRLLYLTWFPDGQTLLFVCSHGGTSFEVGWDYMAISTNGGPPRKLFTNGEGLDLFDNGSKILILRSVEDTGNWTVEISQ